MSDLTSRELKKFREYLEAKLNEIEAPLLEPFILGKASNHDEIAQRATANAYQRAAIEELRIAFSMDLNSVKSKEEKDG